MQTGVITSENFSQLLRSFSQRRKQGVLEITYPDKRLDISFVQGRIVEAILNGENPVTLVAQLLKQAGIIQGMPAEGWEESYESLFRLINDGSADHLVEETLFSRVVKHRVLDQLYMLRAEEGGYYSFNSKMIEHSKHFAPSISVGQLLLDFVALESDKSALAQLFPAGCSLSWNSMELSDGLAEEEAVLCGLMSSPISLAELRSRSLLSEYHFQEGLLGLQRRGMLRIAAAVEAGERSDLSAGLLADLESSIDAAFGAVGGLSDSASENAAAGELQDFESSNAADQPAEQIGDEEFEEGEQDGEELDEEDEDDDYGVAPNARARFGLVSFRILNMNWIPHTVVLAFVLAACLVPFFFWTRMFWTFGY